MTPSKDFTLSPHSGLANNAPSSAALTFANASMVADDQGWTLIPYGMWPHEKGLQNFQRAQAEDIVTAFQSTWARLKRAVVGLPVFKGHPDVPGLENIFPDKTEYGQVADMEVRERGLAIKQVLSSEGAKLVRQGLKFISPFWDARPTGTRSGVIEWSPFKIFSVGLVSKPNIPNLSLANNATDFMNKADLIALFKLPADATDEQVTNAVKQSALANAALANAETEKGTLTAKVTSLETQVATLTTEKTAADTAKTTAETGLANERKARIVGCVTDGIKTGRIAPADRPLWEGRLTTNFDTESVTLANMGATIKTSFTTEQAALAALNERLATMTESEKSEYVRKQLGLSNDGGMDVDGMDNSARVKAISALMDAEKNTPECQALPPGKRHDRAFKNVQSAHPKLFAVKGGDDEA